MHGLVWGYQQMYVSNNIVAYIIFWYSEYIRYIFQRKNTYEVCTLPNMNIKKFVSSTTYIHLQLASA